MKWSLGQLAPLIGQKVHVNERTTLPSEGWSRRRPVRADGVTAESVVRPLINLRTVSGVLVNAVAWLRLGADASADCAVRLVRAVCGYTVFQGASPTGGSARMPRVRWAGARWQREATTPIERPVTSWSWRSSSSWLWCPSSASWTWQTYPYPREGVLWARHGRAGLLARPLEQRRPSRATRASSHLPDAPPTAGPTQLVS